MQPDALVDALISPSDMLLDLPQFVIDDEEVKRVTNGRTLTLSQEQAAAVAPATSKLRLCDSKGSLIAVGDFDSEARLVSPRVVLQG
jgi:tRNA U55 pseudouridine synthase TruB